MGQMGDPVTRSSTYRNAFLFVIITAWTGPSVDREVAQHGNAHVVELPHAVVDHLEVPSPPSRAGVEGRPGCS